MAEKKKLVMGRKKKGKRYTPGEKRSLLAQFKKLHAGGKTAQASAQSVGVPYITLNNWGKKAGGGAVKKVAERVGRKPGLKPGRKPGRPANVKKAAMSVSAGGIVLVTPQGYRIEGINAGDLVTILSALK
jgi:hypothetical protein